MNEIKGFFNWINDKNLFTSLRRRLAKKNSNGSSGIPVDKLSEKEKKNLLTKTIEKMKKNKNKSTKCVAASHISTKICNVVNSGYKTNHTDTSQHKPFTNRNILLKKGCDGKLKNKPIGRDNPIQDALEKEGFWSDRAHCGNDVMNSLFELQKEIDEKAKSSAPQSDEVKRLIEENRRIGAEKSNSLNNMENTDDILEVEEEIVFGGNTRKRNKKNRKTKRKRKRKTKRKRKRKTRGETKRKRKRKTKRKR